MTLRPVHIGCSGWNYASWRGAVYPPGCPPRRWLAVYAESFPTVEVNSTFYRLARPEAVARWVADTPADFVFAVKASRYLTHIRRLRDMEQGVEKLYAGIAPLVGTKLGPVLWQLPASFHRDDDRLLFALERLPPGRHGFEFRHPSWFCSEVYGLLHTFGAALVWGDDPRRPLPEPPLTADFAFLRLHYGRAGRRGNYSERELRAWAKRIAALRSSVEVFAYLNNDWEAFAPRNAARLRRLVADESGPATRSILVNDDQEAP